MYHYAANNPVKYTDPDGRYTEEEKHAFFWLLPEEQMNFLKKEYESVQGENHTDLERGIKAAEMRELREYMYLIGLFMEDESFMNIELRDFLNLKEDGTMNYNIEDLTKENGWKELCSIGSQYHQTGATTKLNAKFVNEDGREVVISYLTKKVVTTYPDKGTYNYENGNIFNSWGWGNHKLYDMIPYEKYMKKMDITYKVKCHGVFKGGLLFGNTHYW